MRAFVPGIYPRSEALVQATRDLDRGRTTPEAVDERLARDLAAFVAVQQDAGLDLLADGMLGWQDLFRPLLDASEGLEPGALTRFLDTNTFFRAPHATHTEPRLGEPLAERYLAPLPGSRVVTLPSPWAMAKGTGLKPSVVARGGLVHVSGNADGCPVGDTVLVLSRAFRGPEFAGVHYIGARVRAGGAFAATGRIRRRARPGRYGATARCGGGNLGVLARFRVR